MGVGSTDPQKRLHYLARGERPPCCRARQKRQRIQPLCSAGRHAKANRRSFRLRRRIKTRLRFPALPANRPGPVALRPAKDGLSDTTACSNCQTKCAQSRPPARRPRRPLRLRPCNLRKHSEISVLINEGGAKELGLETGVLCSVIERVGLRDSNGQFPSVEMRNANVSWKVGGHSKNLKTSAGTRRSSDAAPALPLRARPIGFVSILIRTPALTASGKRIIYS